jgi:hypothetical protein
VAKGLVVEQLLPEEELAFVGEPETLVWARPHLEIHQAFEADPHLLALARSFDRPGAEQLCNRSPM